MTYIWFLIGFVGFHLFTETELDTWDKYLILVLLFIHTTGGNV
jgi:hypothetical protein